MVGRVDVAGPPPVVELTPYRGGLDLTAWFATEAAEFAGGPGMLSILDEQGFSDCYLATVDGEPAALIATGTLDCTTINPLLVAPTHERRGIGSAALAVLSRLPEFAGGELIGRIERVNVQSIACFERAGFTVEDEHSDTTSVLMSLRCPALAGS